MGKNVKLVPSIQNPDDTFERDVRDILGGIQAFPILRGVLVKAALTTGFTAVPHTLGRTPSGFLNVDPISASAVWRDPTKPLGPTLHLAATTAATYTLWIF